MQKLLGMFMGSVLAATLTYAGGFAGTDIRGDYVEARSANVYTGPCFANGEANQAGDLAVFGWSVGKGAWQGVSLNGLSVVGVVRASNTLGSVTDTPYPVKAVLIVDSRANARQALALQAFAQRMGAGLLQDIVRIDYEPITFTLRDNNLHTATVTLNAGIAQIQTRALALSDNICHNEETYYPPLTKLDHAMPAYTLANRFEGAGLDAVWSSPGKRSAFVGSFHLEE